MITKKVKIRFRFSIIFCWWSVSISCRLLTITFDPEKKSCQNIEIWYRLNYFMWPHWVIFWRHFPGAKIYYWESNSKSHCIWLEPSNIARKWHINELSRYQNSIFWHGFFSGTKVILRSLQEIDTEHQKKMLENRKRIFTFFLIKYFRYL